MKKLYAQLSNDGLPINVDIQNAIDGFIYLGYDVIGFNETDVLSGKMDYRAKNNMFVGSIDGMTALFKNMGKYPEPIDFPESIVESGLLNRNIFTMKLDSFIEMFKQTKKPMFVKPVQTKLFDGILISDETHLNYLRDFDNPLVLVCDKIDIVSEFRAYVHNGKLVYCCNYSGDFKLSPNYNYIDMLIKNYKDAPVAYTIDVAILNDRSMTAIEFNDFWSIGAYGLYSIDYARMLEDRYFEIIK
jgi:hypothetical protein